MTRRYVMSESRVQDIINVFSSRYLKGKGSYQDETLLGFVVLDENKEVIVASSFDPNYGITQKNPIKNWIIYKNQALNDIRAFVMNHPNEFKEFALNNYG